MTEKKIRNNPVLLVMIFGFGLHLLLFFSKNIDGLQLIGYLINIFFATLIGFGLYFIDFWSAGDGKLLIAYSFIMPFEIFSRLWYNGWQAPLTILINTFLPVLLFSIIYVFFADLSLHKNQRNEKKSIMPLVTTVLYVFSLTWLCKLFLNFISLPDNIIAVMIMSAGATFMIEKVKKNLPNKKKTSKEFIFFAKHFELLKSNLEIIIFLIIAGIRISLEYKTMLNFAFLQNFILFYILIHLIRRYLKQSTVSFFTKKVHVANLSQDMIINDTIIKEDYKKDHMAIKEKPKTRYYIDNKFSLKNISNKQFQHPLTEVDIRLMNKLYKSNKLKFKQVSIQNTMPFAPLMLIGIIITLLTEGSILFSIMI